MNWKRAALSLLFTLLLASGAEAGLAFVQIQNYMLPMWQFASSKPAANQPLSAPPKSVTLNFSTAIDMDKSAISVFDPYGNKLDTGPLTSTGNNISVTMPQLPPGYSGAYRVDWKASCQCTDTTPLNGSFFFSID